MSRFTAALVVSPMSDGHTWVVVRPFGYKVGGEGGGDVVEVQIGFQTDFASVPRLFWVFLPKWGTYGNASVVHDWLYWDQRRERAEADAIFRQAMGALGVGAFTRLVMYSAVRLFGGIAWYRNQADRAEGFDRVLATTTFPAVTRSKRPGTMARFAQRARKRILGIHTSAA